MARNKTTSEEMAHLLLVKQLPCVVDYEEWYDFMIQGGRVFKSLGRIQSEAHHITNAGRRLGHYFTLPLSIENHRGNKGFSGNNRSAWDKSLANQLRLLEKIYKVLGKEMPEIPKTKIVRGYELPK